MTKFALDREPRMERRSIASRKIVLHLPFPPSVNAMFFNSRTGRNRTNAYNAWATEAGWRIKEQKPGAISGPVNISILLEDKHPTSDCDNRIKACLDILTPRYGMGIIDGDNAKTVRKVSAEWADVEGVIVTVECAG